jgi:hypothetical protein
MTNSAPYGSGLNPGSFLGEVEVQPHETTEYADYDKVKWALEYIERYGSIDGAHHKDWVLDQVSRILLGTPVLVKQAKWESGFSEYRVNTGEPTPQYHAWVKKLQGEEIDGEYEWDYSEGIAP